MYLRKRCVVFVKRKIAIRNGIIIFQKGDVVSYKCINYKPNKAKIIPYKKPLIVTAKRDYTIKTEI
jgi:hypothetical protein